MDTWYFAYGSNMSVDRKEQRTGKIRQAIRACLSGYRLAFNKRADDGGVYANIVPDPKNEVWGVLYLSDQSAMRMLDVKEGVPSGHYVRERVTVAVSSGERIECTTYVAGDAYLCQEQTPADDYLKHILAGARDHDLPHWYIEDLRKIGMQQSP